MCCSRVTQAYLAYTLQNRDRMLEETDMEYRYDEFDVGIMTDTVDRIQPTCLTESILFCGSLFREPMSMKNEECMHSGGTHQTPVEYTILHGKTVNRCIEIAMSYFKLGDFDRVLVIEDAELKLFADGKHMM